MINTNILLSKIVANSTDRTWSQAYSTLNLYIVLSIEADSVEEETIATHGKETLEKLQREFFALDQKNLHAIKGAVENTVKSIPHNLTYSIILATISENILYIITAGVGIVIIKRGKDIGIVAQGEEKQVTAFSGLLENHDVVVLTTESFFQKVPLAHLKSLLHEGTATDYAENVAPIIHGNSRGTEAAMFLVYRSHHETQKAHENVSEEEDELQILTPEAQELQQPTIRRRLLVPSIAAVISKLPKVSFSKETVSSLIKNKVALVAMCIILLVIVLGIGLIFERNKAKSAANQVLLESILTPAQKKYDDAMALASLNRALAMDSLQQDKQTLEQSRNKFPDGSPEQKKIDDLLSKVNSALGQGPDSATNIKGQKTLVDTSTSEIKQIGGVTYKGQALSVVDSGSGTLYVLSKDDGSIQTKVPTDAKSAHLVTGDKGIVYILGDSTYKIDTASKRATKLFDVANNADIVGFDTFLGNLYLLNKSDKSITKYLSGSSDGTSYLIGGAQIAKNPTSLSIDSSIWVGEDSTFERFTKGRTDPVSIKGLSKPLGSNAQIYTDVDYSDVYVLDPSSARVVAFDKSGTFSNQYSNKLFQNATSFAVDEVSRRIFAVSGNKLYSFDF